ncbi:MAG TPA: hypothetical protein VGM54_06740 [Chthoniobacter sp.]|jgi:hypothetical protein
MAWQLIYTSAPRSLEAGRSGFGTVARHRAISPLLVSTIERSSQFSRLPGVDTERVIFSYRIINIAGGRFHVLSSIRDSGADYTGRTNHIAHHLVAETREIAQIGAHGPSPADVLLGMHWATSWQETPRYFEAVDEIPLANFQRVVSGSAWERTTGNSSQAWLLATGEGSRGAYVIRPGELDLRQVFGESLRLIPERLWQISFTTSLQPSDEPADFRWIGIEASSPLRVQTETSGRPVFNLTEPATLPTIDIPQPAAAAAPVAVAAVTGGGAGPAELPAWSAQGLPPPSAVRTPAPASEVPIIRPAAQMPRDRTSYPLPPPRPVDRRKLWIASGSVAALAVLAVLIFQVVVPWYQDLQARKEQRQSIRTIVDGSGYFTGTRTTPNIDTELKPLSLVELQKLRNFAELTEGMLEAMRAADFPKMAAARQAYESYRRENPVNGLDLLPKFNAVADKVQTALRLDSELSSVTVGPEGYDVFEQLQQKAASIEGTLGDYIPDGVKMKARLDAVANDKQASALMALLRGSSRPAQGTAWFESALEKIQPGPEETETRKVIEMIQRIIVDWKFVEAQQPNKSTAQLEARLKEQSRDPIWPTWLRGLAEAKIKTARPAVSSEPRTSRSDQAPLSHLPDAANALPSTLSLQFFSDEQHFPIELPARSSGISYYLRVEGKSDELLQPFAGDVSRGLGPFGEYFKIRDGKLQAGAKPPRMPYIFVGKRDNSDMFRIYVGMGRDDKSIFGTTETGLTRDGDALVVDLSKLPGSVSQPLWLRLPPDFGVKGSKYRVVEVQAGRADISAVVQEMKDELARVSSGGGGDDITSPNSEINAIRTEIRKLSAKPKAKAQPEKKPAPGGKPLAGNAGDVPADIGLTRPAEMLAVLFENFWDEQVGSHPNPAEKIRAELAKKPDQANWGALLTELHQDFQYGTADWIGKSEFDKRLAWAQQAEKLAERVCNYEYRKQVADKDAAAVAARAAKAAEEAKRLGANALMNGKVPPGFYTLLVGDGDRKLPVLDYKAP